MAKKSFLRLLLWGMSTPQLAISKWLEYLSPGEYGNDLEKCLYYVDRYQKSVPVVFTDALIKAEDHRNPYHPGIDPIGMLRALWVCLLSGQIQGASTIEQQFVRVATGRYERTIIRKVREQFLAIALVRRCTKESIASAYLAIAFYGNGCSGLEGLKVNFGPRLYSVSEQQALRFISQLKYPRPLQPSVRWHNKINIRTGILWERRTRAATNLANRLYCLILAIVAPVMLSRACLKGRLVKADIAPGEIRKLYRVESGLKCSTDTHRVNRSRFEGQARTKFCNLGAKADAGSGLGGDDHS